MTSFYDVLASFVNWISFLLLYNLNILLWNFV